ncbi:hypothetical protein NQZ68_009016 [Dissostichus eleginoides]|nr:hypothetical protein NQZ68_009016 [Dissostichus eleginoides]
MTSTVSLNTPEIPTFTHPSLTSTPLKQMATDGEIEPLHQHTTSPMMLSSKGPPTFDDAFSVFPIVA